MEKGSYPHEIEKYRIQKIAHSFFDFHIRLCMSEMSMLPLDI